MESDEVPISRLDSTILYDNITAETIKKCNWDSMTVGDEVRLETANDEAQLDLATGRISTLEELEHVVRDQSSEDDKQENIPGRYSSAVRSRRSNAETLPERYLTQVAEASTPGPYSPPLPDFIARATISHEEFMRKNPTKRQADKGPDRALWEASDAREREQLTTPQEGRIGPVMREISRSQVPVGMTILPITKQRKIKSNGTYKTRWCVMGNLDDFNGPTYASTASKKVV